VPATTQTPVFNWAFTTL